MSIAEQASDRREHTIRFTHGRRWRCSCGGFGYSEKSAEIHAHAVGGRIEMPRRAS